MTSHCNLLGFKVEEIFGASLPYSKEITNGSVIEIYYYYHSLSIEVLKISEILEKITKSSNVAKKPCLAKIYRTLKSDKEKRGQETRSELQLFAEKNDDLQQEITKQVNINLEYKEQNKQLRTTIAELQTLVTYLESLIQDTTPINLIDAEKRMYCNNVVECAINLTNLKVATKNIGPVLKKVAKLCGKTLVNIPSRQAVDTFVDRKVALSHKYVGKVAASSTSTTLYTDETRKHGKTYQTYVISDIESS